LCRLIRRPDRLIGRHCGISRQTEGHSFGDHLTSESVRVTFFLREIGWDGVNWIDMAQDRDQWRALVNMVLNLQVP
jgi:hypothetical protein